ncbi:MAG: DUF1638 domain-containing protein [Spirochaetota bacterium]
MPQKNKISFQDYSIIGCGTMNLEINYLKKTGFLDAKKILFTKPGRHEVPQELESQLVEKIDTARQFSGKIIVVYGGKFCYLNASNPARTIDQIIEEKGKGITRINATHCVDMLAGAEERVEISKGENVFWLTPGWIVYRNYVFQDWDKGKANENFPHHTGGAILLDGINFWEGYSENHPEKILDFSDWMGIPIQTHKVSLARFKRLLLDCAEQ